MLGVNHAPLLNFSSLQLPGVNQATLTQPPTFWVWEDTPFVVPPLVLVDREQTLAACANNIYTLTITVRAQANKLTNKLTCC